MVETVERFLGHQLLSFSGLTQGRGDGGDLASDALALGLQELQVGGQRGQIVPAVITVYEDRSFSLVTKTPPTSALLRQAAGLTKGSSRPNGAPVATLTRAQVREVAQRKLPDLNTDDLDVAEKTVAGTARSMGIAITH
ncbi:MAG: 50S ribosomal protein L11 [Pseudonocardia sp.]|nr:50S ribosomal protein L11 [Pseudonocardia sp.]